MLEDTYKEARAHEHEPPPACVMEFKVEATSEEY